MPHGVIDHAKTYGKENAEGPAPITILSCVLSPLDLRETSVKASVEGLAQAVKLIRRVWETV